MKRRQDLDFTVLGKLTRLHVVELLLSPGAKGRSLDFDRGLGNGLSDLQDLGSDVHTGRSRVLSKVIRVEVNCLG
jgi:hypothetical protein